MKYPSPSNINHRRSLSEQVSRIFDLIFEWDGLMQLFGVFAGFGCLAYIFATWLQAFLGNGSYLAAFILALAGLILAALSLARIPVALFTLLACSVVSAVAFLGGYFQLLLP